jgi:hypothetical protein
MVDGIKGKAFKEYKIQWGKWFTIAGIFCALVCYVVSAWVCLFPKLNINNVNSSGSAVYGDSFTFTQGFYNLKFFTWTRGGTIGKDLITVNHNELSLSIAGIVMIVFAGLSILFPLIGYAKAQNRLFYKFGNGLFTWFLGFIIIMGLLMIIATFLGYPAYKRDPNDIFRSTYFKGSNVSWLENDLGLNHLWLKPTTNYWILFGLTVAGAVSIVVFAVLTTKKMFFRGAEHRQLRSK